MKMLLATVKAESALSQFSIGEKNVIGERICKNEFGKMRAASHQESGRRKQGEESVVVKLTDNACTLSRCDHCHFDCRRTGDYLR
jgi:hypothetical protein